jgi:hypothetical protein
MDLLIKYPEEDVELVKAGQFTMELSVDTAEQS